MDNQKNPKIDTKGKNPNHFPEETLSEQRDQPYEGDDKQGAMGDDTNNPEMKKSRSGRRS